MSKVSEYGILLREIREQHNETQSEMAERVAVSTTVISNIELGKVNIPNYFTRCILSSYKELTREQRQRLVRAEINHKRIKYEDPHKKLRQEIAKLLTRYMKRRKLWQNDNLYDKGNLYQLNQIIADLEDLIK